MKHRVPIATTKDFESADKIRRAKEEASPESEFQVRRFRKGFKVVERINDGADGA